MDQADRAPQRWAPPPEIARSLCRFKRDHRASKRLGFIMMVFGKSRTRTAIIKAIRSTLEQCNIRGLRADDKEYHPDLHYSVLTYMHGCGFGIAVFEAAKGRKQFNPNVSFELGYMEALGKDVCLLKDKGLARLHSDLIGQCFREYDPKHPKKTIGDALRGWLIDKDHAKERDFGADMRMVPTNRRRRNGAGLSATRKAAMERLRIRVTMNTDWYCLAVPAHVQLCQVIDGPKYLSGAQPHYTTRVATGSEGVASLAKFPVSFLWWVSKPTNDMASVVAELTVEVQCFCDKVPINFWVGKGCGGDAKTEFYDVNDRAFYLHSTVGWNAGDWKDQPFAIPLASARLAQAMATISNYYDMFEMDALAKKTKNIWAIAIDREGVKWIGTYGNGVSCFDGRKWRTFTAKDGLASNGVRAIACDPNGRKWFGTFDGQVSCFDGQNWKTYTEMFGRMDDYRIWTIAIDAEGRKWFGNIKGVACFDGRNWTTFTVKDGLAYDHVFAIAIDAEGRKWFGTRGVSCFDGKNWKTYTMQDAASNVILAIAIDREGRKWFGTNGGVYCLSGQELKRYKVKNGLAGDQVTAIAIDPKGRKWFGTNHGVCCFDGNAWRTWTTKDGLAGDYVLSLAVDLDASIWAGTNLGLSHLVLKEKK